jgi:cellobiose epimerase
MNHSMEAAAFSEELIQILHWWATRMPDPANGGFWGRIDGFGQVHPEAEKGVILNTRILWTFSAASRAGFPDTSDTANRAFHYLLDHFLDREQGGVYWSVAHNGHPFNTKKQVYAQAFAIYAFSEYYRSNGHVTSLEIALQLFDLLEKNALDPIKNGYFEAYSRDWQLLDDLRLSDKDANEAKTQNTHLHLLEAYANLLRALQERPSPTFAPFKTRVTNALHNLIGLFLDRFIEPKTAHIHLFFDENWVLKSDIVSFGHDIEASWLLWDAAQTVGDPALLQQVQPVCLRIAAATLHESVDEQGAVINQRWNSDGRHDTDRIWWVQAEAIVGFWNAFVLSGDVRYKHAAIRCWQFTRQNMRDLAQGEWYWRIGSNGEHFPEEDKAGFWKCPYHNGRAMLWMYQALA